MTNLGSRLTALERQADAATGCRGCEGQMIVGVREGPDGSVEYPDWLDEQGRCRRCLTHIKLYPADLLEKLA